MSFECAQIRPMWAKIRSRRAGFGRFWAKLGRCRSKSPKFGQSDTDRVRPVTAQVRPKLAWTRPSWGELDNKKELQPRGLPRERDSAQIRPILADGGQVCAALATFLSQFVKTWPKWNKHGRTWAECGPTRPTLKENWPAICKHQQSRPKLVRAWPTMTNEWSTGQT